MIILEATEYHSPQLEGADEAMQDTQPLKEPEQAFQDASEGNNIFRMLGK